MAPFAAYIRVSKEREEMRSPDFQRDAITAYAERENIELEWLPEDLGVSGSLASRKELETAIRRCESGDLGGLIVYRLDRLSRMSLPDRARLFDRLDRANARIVSTQENLDASTPEGRAMREIFATFARMQWERYRDGWNVSRREAIKRGAFVGPVPIGYKRPFEAEPLVPDPDTMDLVRECYRRRIEGASWSTLARFLTDAGYPMTRLGVRQMIRSRVYLGESRSGEFVNEHAHPALVDIDTWELAHRAEPPRTRMGRESALLAGLSRCAGCGRTMTQTVGRDRQDRPLRSYTCRTPDCPGRASICVHLLDPLIEATVVEHIRGARFHASARIEVADDAKRTLAEAVTELASLQGSAGRLIGAMGEGEYVEILEVHRERVDVARREVANTRLPEPLTIDLNWDTLMPSVRRSVIRGGIRAIWCWPGRDPVIDRIRVQAADPHIDYPVLSGRGKRSDLITVDRWGDLPGEIALTE